MRILYELFNTETEKVESEQFMTDSEARIRNEELRRSGDPRRWILGSEED